MALYLPASLGPLATLCPTDNGRYAMAGVRVCDPGDGTFRCDVTDGRSLLVARGVCPLDDDTPGNFPAIIPAGPWKDIFAEKIKNPRGILDPIRVQVHPGAGHDTPFDLRVGPVTRCGRTIDGRYPDVDQVLPKKPPVFAIHVNPEYLAALLTVMAKLLPDEQKRVTLAFWKPDVPMAVVAKDHTHGTCLDGLLMPLVDPTPVRKGATA